MPFQKILLPFNMCNPEPAPTNWTSSTLSTAVFCTVFKAANLNTWNHISSFWILSNIECTFAFAPPWQELKKRKKEPSPVACYYRNSIYSKVNYIDEPRYGWRGEICIQCPQRDSQAASVACTILRGIINRFPVRRSFCFLNSLRQWCHPHPLPSFPLYFRWGRREPCFTCSS